VPRTGAPSPGRRCAPSTLSPQGRGARAALAMPKDSRYNRSGIETNAGAFSPMSIEMTASQAL